MASTEPIQLEVNALKRLHDLDPSYAKRYLRQFERGLRTERALAWIGLLSGFIVAMTGLVISGRLIADGYTIGGSILGTADLLGLTALFITRQRG